MHSGRFYIYKKFSDKFINKGFLGLDTDLSWSLTSNQSFNIVKNGFFLMSKGNQNLQPHKNAPYPRKKKMPQKLFF